MTDRNRDIFIALIDAGLDESSVLAFIEGRTDDAGTVVGALATDAHLAELVWQLRADRLALIADATSGLTPDETESMVSAVLDQELGDELDRGALAAIEATGRAATEVPRPAHPAVKVRRVRRVPRRARRVVFSLASAAVVVLVLSIALPRIDFASTSRPLGTETADLNAGAEAPIALALDDSDPSTPSAGATTPSTTPDGPSILSRPLESPVLVTTAGEALRLAQSGRLVVRLVSSRPDSTRSLAAQLSGDGELSRVALVEGKLPEEPSLQIAKAMPAQTPVIMASADDRRAPGEPRVKREAVGSYMLRVEPSERAFTLLLAKLRDRPGVTLELVGTVEPVTTPASARSLASLAGEPASWRSRIGVPVVVEEIR